jgi:hypothetical protein
MFRRLAARLRPTVFVAVSREAITFATDRDEVTIAAAVRVDAAGRILGFGMADGGTGERTVAVFQSSGGGSLSADEAALAAVCRRGLADVLRRRIALRPGVVLSVPPALRALTDVVGRALRRAGAADVVIEDGSPPAG